MTLEHQQLTQKTTRVLVPAGVIACLSLLVLALVLAVRLLPEKYETALGDYPPPLVLNRVAGVPGPAAHLGEVLVLRGDRCVNRNTNTTTTTIWTYVGPNAGPGNLPNSQQIKGPTSKGCMSATYNLQMPEKVIPGEWAVQGVVRDIPSGDVRYWQSGEFLVVQ